MFRFVIFAVYVICMNSHWIDPDTRNKDSVTYSLFDEQRYDLVFSDEFNRDNRQFKDGFDPRWTAIHKNDYTNFALHYYNEDLVSTHGGHLNITSIIKDVSYNVHSVQKKDVKRETKNYQAAMIQGWNKFCFTGGIVEISAKLPGKAEIGGLWPAMWLLGNLARATYVGSSNNVWPWSYDECSPELQHKQAISACNLVNHFNMHSKQGRGAPEVDILEAMPGKAKLINTPISKPYFSTSFQVAPGFKDYRPTASELPDLSQWYSHDIQYAESNTDLNVFFYGMNLEGVTPAQSYTADAISANTNLLDMHFEDFHKYRLEWLAGDEGYLKWYLDDKFLFGIGANALNETGAMIPEEPMYLILNTAVSSTWGFPSPCPEGCPCSCYDARVEECQCSIPENMLANFPNQFLIDYVRVYQNKEVEGQVVGCSTPTHPSRTYIEGHASSYMSEDAKQPLQPVLAGGAACGDAAGECGEGRCVQGKCVCSEGFTGPVCLAHVAFDDIIWDRDEGISLNSFMLPLPLLCFFLFFVVGFAATMYYKHVFDINQRRALAAFSQQRKGREYMTIIDRELEMAESPSVLQRPYDPTRTYQNKY